MTNRKCGVTTRKAGHSTEQSAPNALGPFRGYPRPTEGALLLDVERVSVTKQSRSTKEIGSEVVGFSGEVIWAEAPKMLGSER
uniref:Transposase n=1 Tax=Steinernema glaseri TaxID=37863 RepID=A0A1I7ZMD7_9BILA